MGFSNMMMAAAKSMPKSTMTQSIPSFTYSSCSTTNMWWLKNCWSFSLTKLIEICSKPLYSNLKPSNVEHSTEVCFLEGGINQSVITFLNEPLEDTIKDSTSNTSSSTSGLLNILTLGHPLCAYFDSGFAESLHHSSSINTKSSSCFTNKSVWATFRQFCLFITPFLDILNTSACHDTSSKDIAIKFLLGLKSKDIESILCVFKLLVVVH